VNLARRSPVPDRVRWAVDVLDPSPAESILEIGGGPGVSAALICARLTTGRLLAVDRSAVAVERTRRRNAEHLTCDRLTVRHCALDALVVEPHTIDKVLALDVNLFWTTSPDRELAILRRALRPDGVLHVLYGSAGPTAAGRVTDAVAAGLRAHGFTDVTVRSAAAGTGVSARTPA